MHQQTKRNHSPYNNNIKNHQNQSGNVQSHLSHLVQIDTESSFLQNSKNNTQMHTPTSNINNQSSFKKNAMTNLQIAAQISNNINDQNHNQNILASPSNGGQSAYISKEKLQGSFINQNVTVNQAQQNNQVKTKGSGNQQNEISDISSPRNAIGGYSGMVTSQPSKYSNIMNRRKSNAMMNSNTAGPVDLTAIIRANRNGNQTNITNDQPILNQTTDIQNYPQQLSTNQIVKKNISSRGMRANIVGSNLSSGKQGSQQLQLQQDDNHGIHLPQMPLTPTEQNKLRERDKNNSFSKNSSNSINQYTRIIGRGADIDQMKNQNGDPPLIPPYQINKRSRDNSLLSAQNGENNLQGSSSNTRENQIAQNRFNSSSHTGQAIINNSNIPISTTNGDLKNPQKLKMIYKKQINTHRATSQTNAINNSAQQKDGQNNIQTQRNNAQGNSHFSPPRHIQNQKAINNALIQSQRDHSNGPATTDSTSVGSPYNQQNQSSIIQNHSFNGNQGPNFNKPPSPLRNNETIDIEKLLLGNGPPPDPQLLNLPSWEPTKCSVRENGLIMGYAANTNQGIIRDYNEDRVSIVLNIMQPPTKKDVENWPKCSFFGVFDGHGGNTCADFLRDNLHQFIIKDAQFPQNPRQSIINGYKKAEQYFLDTVESFAQGRHHMLDKSGSCAIVALLVEKRCFIVNVGDSRAIMSHDGGNFCSNLSLDHKPNDESEQKRILANGGRVYQTQTIARGDTYKQVQTITYQPGQDNSAVLATNIKDREENPNIIYGPFRVFPGRLSVSRTFGDIEAKREKFGGNPNVVVAIPDIKEFIIDDKMDFLLLGCDGIFDKISNAEVLKQGWIAAKRNYHSKDQAIHQTCGHVVEQVMKASVAYKTLDNITVVMLAFKNFKHALSEEFCAINNQLLGIEESNQDLQSKESGAVSNSNQHNNIYDEQSQQRPTPPAPTLNSNYQYQGQNAPIENLDSCNGGLTFYENVETLMLTKDEIQKLLNIPNFDLVYEDIEIMKSKPKMPQVQNQKKLKVSRHGLIQKVAPQNQDQQQSKPLSPAIRRSAINNLVGNPQHPQSSSSSKQVMAEGQSSQNQAGNGGSTLRGQANQIQDPYNQQAIQTNKSSQFKKQNLRVANTVNNIISNNVYHTSANAENGLNNQNNNSFSSQKQDYSNGGQAGIFVMGSMNNRNQNNPTSQREKQSQSKNKDLIISSNEKQKSNEQKNSSTLQTGIMQVNNLGYSQIQQQQLPKSSGFRTNRYSNQMENRLLQGGQQLQRQALQDYNNKTNQNQDGSLFSQQQNQLSSQPLQNAQLMMIGMQQQNNLQTQRLSNNAGNQLKGGNQSFVLNNSGILNQSGSSNERAISNNNDITESSSNNQKHHSKVKISKNNHSMLNNSQPTQQLQINSFNTSNGVAGAPSTSQIQNEIIISRRNKISGSGGLSLTGSSGAAGGINSSYGNPMYSISQPQNEMQSQLINEQSGKNYTSHDGAGFSNKIQSNPSSTLNNQQNRNSRASRSRGNQNKTPIISQESSGIQKNNGNQQNNVQNNPVQKSRYQQQEKGTH